MFARTDGAHVMIAAFQVYFLIAVTLQSPTNLTADRCHGTRYPNGSVEFQLSPHGKRCSYVWLHNDTVLAYGGDDGTDSMDKLVVTHTTDFLILRSPLENIFYEEDCQQGIFKVPCVCSILDSPVLHPDDNRRHHYVVPVLVLVAALPFILTVVPAVLCKKHQTPYCPATRLPAEQRDTV